MVQNSPSGRFAILDSAQTGIRLDLLDSLTTKVLVINSKLMRSINVHVPLWIALIEMLEHSRTFPFVEVG